MTADGAGAARVSSDESQTRQRKKRKWDQPAESLASIGLALPGVLPLANMGSLAGTAVPTVAPVAAGLLMNSLPANGVAASHALHSAALMQQSAVVAPKLNQQKGQEDLMIAREIVINDAESAVRYKLTKRQTQEEIQNCTGAVVTTRGKYRPPNALPDGGKPLYLHISAGAHLKETVERIIAVDRAAAMIEEMLKQGQNSQPVFYPDKGVKISQALSTCVYLGFDVDPSWNIASRIRGPNDQYINHIMNETGATVLLRGRGSVTSESLHGEEGQQPLHLFLSSNNAKSLESAKSLAENLLDTISLECGASRVSSSKVYGAVPPPQQLVVGSNSSRSEVTESTNPATGLTSTSGFTTSPPLSSPMVHGVSSVFTQGAVSMSGGVLGCIQTQPNMVHHSQPLVTGGTRYSGYEGIYPQATPMQQVALVLKQSTSVTSSVASAPALVSMMSELSSKPDFEKEKRPPPRRKFQELPVGNKDPAPNYQESACLKLSEPELDMGSRKISTMPPPKKLVLPLSNAMPPPPPKSMPPLPPKFTAPKSSLEVNDKAGSLDKSRSEIIPDTLVKLMEYGDEDDDPDESSEESLGSNSTTVTTQKPFWAV
ncbi:protein RIK isoform X2 [Syzygium oleosum]|uniref:protein RIK isoform X2 n=1 Tax=Syzygium oleosum TaxID=219896 RepID=UPI0011D1AE43|nr:protein RIK isoform X2 [Syzygium oleosum]